MDINVGKVIDGTLTLEEAGGMIYREILDVASGEPSKAEILGHDELFGIGRFELY